MTDKPGMPQLDFSTYPSQLFWLAVVFFALYYVMARHIVPRIHMVLENRQQRIDYDLDRAASLKAEAEQARESYEMALADARGQAQQMLNEVAESIRETSEQKHQELDTALGEMIAESERAIQQARIAADRQLEPTAAEVALVLVEKVAGIKASKDEMQKLISEHNRIGDKTKKAA